MKILAVPYSQLRLIKTLAIPVFEKEPLHKEAIFSHIPESTRRAIEKFYKEVVRGTEGEVKPLWQTNGNLRRIIFFGLGKKEQWNARKAILLPRRVIRFAKQEKIKELATLLFSPQNADHETVRKTAKLFSENAVMAYFEFTKYKEKPKEGWPEIHTLHLLCQNENLAVAAEGIKDGLIVGHETNQCRALANTPGSDMTPALLANAAKNASKGTKIRVTIFDERRMEKIGMGAILGVARGSEEKPRFIILEYKNGTKNQKPLVLVGKGVTFDTGGLNLKPDQYIYEMHMDMSGGAAVIHAIAAIARLKLSINIVGLVPAVENMPSGSSYRPGDLLKSLSGKTIEVLNTDAEGRIILADALTYGLRYKPGLMIDIATLTGAAHVALGNYLSGLFTKEKDTKLQNTLLEIGNQSGDYLWPLPLWDEYLAEIKGTFGDLANTGVKDRYGGATHGAKFLEQFAGDARFAHIDMAPRMTASEGEFLAKGAAGFGVRFFVELAKQYQKIPQEK